MILCSVSDFERYLDMNSRFDAMLDALDLEALKQRDAGRHDILGDELFVVASPGTPTRSNAMLEAHRQYVDVHVLLDGTESIGWACIDDLVLPDKEFDVVRDFICYRDPHVCRLTLKPGQLLVCFPEDAHAPLLGSGNLVHKCVFKVLVDAI